MTSHVRMSNELEQSTCEFPLPRGERLKSMLVRTPFEQPFDLIRQVFLRIRGLRNPALVHLECDEPIAIEEYLARTLPHTANCIDVGAHLGRFLNLLLHLAPKGQHVAFEPIPAKVKLLKQKFPEAQVHQLALGEACEQRTFHMVRSTTAASGLDSSSWNDGECWDFEVTQSRLDDIIPPDHRVDFLKLDVEGNECNVLKGAPRIMKEQRPLLLFESGPDCPVREIFDLLDNTYDYDVFTPEALLSGETPLSLADFEQGHVWPWRALNYFATPRASDMRQV